MHKTVYIFVNTATFSLMFEKLFDGIKSENNFNAQKLHRYRKQYGYLCHCVVTFNEKIGFNILMALFSLAIQICMMVIFSKQLYNDLFVISATIAGIFFAFTMYGTIQLVDAVSANSVTFVTLFSS